MNETRSGEAMRLLAAGAAHIDRRGRCGEPYRAGASNPGTLLESVGGAAFNALRAFASLGGEAALLSARGGDRNGIAVGEALHSLGIGDSAVTWLDRPTPTYTAILDENGDLVAGLADMALYDLMQSRIFRRRHIRALLADAAAILLDANLPEATLARLAADAAKPVFAIGVSPAKVGRLSHALPHLAAVFLSRSEAAQLAGVDPSLSGSAVMERLRNLGCRAAVITDGPHAATIFDEDRICWQSPPPVAGLRDVTGAGDTLAGVAAFFLTEGLPLADAARLGMAGASLHVSADREPDDFTPATLRVIAGRMPPLSFSRPD